VAVSFRKLQALTSPGVALGVLMAFVFAATAADAAGARLSLTKTVRKSSGANQVLIYRLTAKNKASKPARGVRLTNAVPAGTHLVSASRGCSMSGASTMTCNLGTIPGRGSVTVTIVLRPTVGGVTTPGVTTPGSTSSPSVTVPVVRIPTSRDPSTLSAAGSPPVVVTTPSLLPACTRTITGRHLGAVIVHAGETVCFVNANQIGAVIVHAGGGLSVVNSTINGAIDADGATFVSICGSPGSPYLPAGRSVVGSVSIRGTIGPVTIGAPPGGGCSPNQIGGALLLTGNRGGTTVFGNTFGGGIDARLNLNGLLIGGNNLRGGLACSLNVPPPTDGGVPNNAVGAKTGQCAAL
jgi:uncharacterized repeat protein (TIGR01451 family)